MKKTTIDLSHVRTLRYEQRKPLDFETFKLRSAYQRDYTELVREPFLLYEGDRLLIAYFHLGADPRATKPLNRVWRTLQTLKFTRRYRSDGLPHTSRTFGYLPRVTTRRDYCTASTTAAEFPEAHTAVVEASGLIAEYYEAVNPTLYDEHRRQIKRVADDFVIEDSPFTSGIINHNNPLRYHFDRGNFIGVWSAMLGFKRDIGGGYLALPEFGIGAEIADRSLLMFDGQNILHGVTPIRRLSGTAERFSVVYYSMRTMWNCQPIGTEIERIRHRRTDREYRRAGRTPASEPTA